MRVESQQVFQVSIQLYEFLNVDLKERGYYHVRLTPKKTSEMASIAVDYQEEEGAGKKHILKGHVTKGVAVSKTIEVSFMEEALKLDDFFTFGVTFNASPKVCQVRKIEVDVELFVSSYQSRYAAPQFDNFEKLDQRTVQIPLDPCHFTAAARSLYFDVNYFSAITFSVFTSLVAIETTTERRNIVENTANRTSDKLRKLFNTALQALVPATRSIHQFIVRHQHLLKTSVSAGEIDVQHEIQQSLRLFDTAGSIVRVMVDEIKRWNAKISLIFQQMLVLFLKSKALPTQLLLEYDKQRRDVFREAFWYNERSIDEISLRTPFSSNEVFKSINKTQYLKNLPRITLYCEETDCPGEHCPLIFEEKYSRNPDAALQNTLASSATMPAIKVADKQHKSFRERFRKGTKNLLTSRRKSLESSSSTSRKVRERSQTSGALVSDDVKNSKRSLPTPTLESPSRSSAAGNSEDSPREVYTVEQASKESITSSEINDAIRPSVSADDVLALPAPDDLPSTSSAPQPTPHIQNPAEDNPTVLMAAYELLKQREAVKKALKDDAKYEGDLYSEKAGKQTTVFSPIISEFVDSDPIGELVYRVHLVVYVHGLDGSSDDLLPFRLGLEQAVGAHYHSAELLLGARLADPMFADMLPATDEPSAGPWKFEHLMSSVNKTETWADFKTMGLNLINEIIEQIDNRRAVQRISFICHSLGGLIVRKAISLLPELEMDSIADICHTLMTLNSPHLGVAYVPKHIHWGCQVVKWFKKSQSMEQLTFRDSEDFLTSFLYKMAHENECGKFKHVLLVGNPNDQMVPFMSALLVHSKVTIEDQSRLGEAYRQMMNAILNSMKTSQKTQTVVRYSVLHQLDSSTVHKVSGRADHVMILEDEAFIEKFFNISAVKYFV